MQNYVDYIEMTFQGAKDNGTLYRYKRQLLDKMTERAAAITHAGLHDEKVLYDLVISEFPDLPGDYRRFCEADRLKRRDKYFNRLMIFGTPIVAIACVLVFLAIGFLTQRWSPAWVLVPDGILIWVIFLLSEGIRRITRQRRLFHPIARIMLALAVMCATVCVFLVAMAALHLPDTWVIFPFGVICLYAADAIYATITKQKMRIINYLIYIVAASPMVYVLLGGLRLIPWHPGWLIVPFAVLLDLIIIAIALANNAKYQYKPELEDAWNEN